MPIPERPQALQRQSAKSVVYQTVCDWIITGVMKPGEKILDSELASYFNVSRTPVREALQLLQNQKLVCVIPGRTTVVADLDVEDFEKCYRPLAEIDALDLDGKIRNLSGDKLSYFDGNTSDPIRFYGDAVDLINGTSLLQNAGEYHFYLATIGYEKVLWVGEADRTFTMEQSTIDLANDFAAAFDLVTETRLMEDQDVSALTQEEKTQAVQDYFGAQIEALNLGITASVVYDDNPDYPDDYVITLTKDGVESSDYVTVYFGAAE